MAGEFISVISVIPLRGVVTERKAPAQKTATRRGKSPLAIPVTDGIPVTGLTEMARPPWRCRHEFPPLTGMAERNDGNERHHWLPRHEFVEKSCLQTVASEDLTAGAGLAEGRVRPTATRPVEEWRAITNESLHGENSENMDAF